MRKKIYNLIEPYYYTRRVSIYNIVMIIVIILSIVPLMIREHYEWFLGIEIVSAIAFVVDYFFRLLTADYKYDFIDQGVKKHSHPFLSYPFTLMALFDLAAAVVSVLWVIMPQWDGNHVLMMLRIFGAFKIFRYTKNKTMIVRVLRRQKKQLLSVCVVALEYILITAVIAFNAEPETFDTIFDAIYWTTVLLTTVGFGDIYPTSNVGHIITIISSFFGIAIIAMPSGILTAGFMREIEEDRNKNI